MGWRGALRSFIAVSRAIERDNLRRRRESERQQLVQAKQLQRATAYETVAAYERHLDTLTSLHHSVSETINWYAVAAVSEEVPPEKTWPNCQKVENELGTYRPSLVDRLFFRADRKRVSLKLKLLMAREADEQKQTEALEKYHARIEELRRDKHFAERAISQDPETLKLIVVRYQERFKEVLGVTGLQFRFARGCPPESEVDVYGIGVLPAHQLSLLKTGQISEK
jgi:hypothetical protein